MIQLLKQFFTLFVPRATASLSTLSELLKQVYDPVIEEQQNLEAFTWKEFGDGEDKLGGQGWYFESKMGGNQEGIGARAEGGTLPTPGYQRWKQGKILWKNLYGAFELTGQVIEAAKGNPEAFAAARTEEIEGLTRDVMKDFNRQIFGDGRGILATINANGGNPATTFTVSDGLYLRNNMVVDIRNNSTGANAFASKAITGLSVNQSTGVMTVTTGSFDTSAINNFWVTRAGSHDGTTVGNYEMEGLSKIIDDGTVAADYLNITRSSYPLFKGNVLSNSGTARNLTLDLIQQAIDACYRMSNKQPDWIRMNTGQRRKFFDLVGPDKRYMSGTIDGGYERLSYNGLTLTVDVDCPRGKIFFLNKNSVRKYYLRKFGLIDFDGLVLRQVTGTDVWRGYVGCYGNIASKHPNQNAILSDLTEPVDYVYVG